MRCCLFPWTTCWLLNGVIHEGEDLPCHAWHTGLEFQEC